MDLPLQYELETRRCLALSSLLRESIDERSERSVSRESILRNLYAAFNENDSDTLAMLVTDDVVVHLLPNDLVPAATLRGRAELIANHEKNLAATQLKQHVLSVSEQGPFATVYIEAVGNDKVGNERTILCADLLRFDGDRICEVVGLVA